MSRVQEEFHSKEGSNSGSRLILVGEINICSPIEPDVDKEFQIERVRFFRRFNDSDLPQELSSHQVAMKNSFLCGALCSRSLDQRRCPLTKDSLSERQSESQVRKDQMAIKSGLLTNFWNVKNRCYIKCLNHEFYGFC